MIKNSVTKLTIYYVLLITILCLSVSTVIYINLVKNTTELFQQEQTRIEKKFGTDDIRYIRRVHFVEEGIGNIQTKAIINLLTLNAFIISIMGVLSYFLAKKTIQPIEENIRRQKDFISNVSHELKTPLTALKTTFEIDLKSTNSQTKISDLKETLKSGIEEVDKMNKLIDGFLKISMLGSKKISLKYENKSLDSIIEEIIKRYDHPIKNKNLKVFTHIENVYVYTDIFLLSELITIIIENAIKFNSTNGEIMIKAYSEGRYDFISIKDTGIGIKNENLVKIFERFYKEDESRVKGDGYGIGLSLAKEIAEILKGHISIKTEEGKGSEFILKFSGLIQK